MSGYQSKIDALHQTESVCSCGEKRSPIVMLNLANDARYGCRWCEVRLIDEPDSFHYLAILRDKSDPAYDWMPSHMRKAGARAGFGYSLASNTPWRLSRRYTVRGEHIWLVDGCVAIDSELPAAQIDEWRAIVDKDTDHSKAQRGLAKLLVLTKRYKEHEPKGIRYHHVRIGDTVIARDYFVMVMALYPNIKSYSTGHRTQDPVLFVDAGKIVAAVMPVLMDERN